LACVVGAADRAQAADWSTWQRQMEAAESAWQQGRLVGAEQRLQDALLEAERLDPRSPQLVRTLTILAELYRKQGRSRDAEAVAARLKGLAAAPATAGPDLESALHAYATLLKELGRADEAAMVAIRLHRLREVRSGPGRGNFLFFNPVAELRDYARLLRQRNRDPEARTIDALAAAEATKLIDRYENLRKGFAATASGGLPSLTWVQQMTGGAEAMEGRLYPEAAALFSDAVRTAEQFPAHDVRLAYSLSMLAVATRAQGKGTEEASATHQAMAILERAAGQGHSLLPKSLSILAMGLLRHRFEPGPALAHLERSLRILEKDLPPDHPVLGLHLAGLAAAHLALGRAAQGVPPLERALAIAEKQYLPEHTALAAGLLTVAEVYAGQGDVARADRVAERVQAIMTRLLDPGHPDVLLTAEIRKGLRERMQQPTMTASLMTATSVPVEVVGNAMLVHVTVNGTQRALMLVDTGASITAIRPLVLRRLGLTVPSTAPRRRVAVVSGETLNVPLVVLDLQVGDARVQNVSTAVVEAFPAEPDVDGLLGADFLQRFKVSLDRSSRRLSLEPLGK
jgi:tetratricopeptide (TPR) repeat protein